MTTFILTLWAAAIVVGFVAVAVLGMFDLGPLRAPPAPLLIGKPSRFSSWQEANPVLAGAAIYGTLTVINVINVIFMILMD